jgi:hypothetical protein
MNNSVLTVSFYKIPLIQPRTQPDIFAASVSAWHLLKKSTAAQPWWGLGKFTAYQTGDAN